MSDIVDQNRKYTLASWTTQATWKPIPVTRAEGVYFYDENDKRYLDWSSQLMNVNIGHSNKYVLDAMQKQAEKLCYAYPGMATQARGKLGELLNEITPHNLSKSFFTTAGADAVENAMKIARLYTGRQKVITRYRSYHGGTFAAMTAGGDPRRLANEPGVPWIVRMHGPYSYRNPVYKGRTQEEGDAIIAALLEDTIRYEGPENIAALMLEGYSGSSGIMQGGDAFWRRVGEICEKYDILLIIDEVMSGFCRMGKWFGIDHYPYIKPDILVMAKGLTSGYVPLGAVTVTDKIAKHFEENTLWAGLTYSSHPFACATAIANIEVYKNENLVDNARVMGGLLTSKLEGLKAKHPSLGEVRGTGLLQVVDIVKNRETHEAMSPFNQPLTEPMQKVAATLIENGINTFVRWNWIFCAPPLIVNVEQLQYGVDIIDKCLDITDTYYKG
jgi:taurine--2-oxoglutarate transaminase